MFTEPPPISLSPDDVEEFRRLIFDEFGEQLSYEEAWQRAHEVMQLFRMLMDGSESASPAPGPTADEGPSSPASSSSGQ